MATAAKEICEHCGGAKDHAQLAPSIEVALLRIACFAGILMRIGGLKGQWQELVKHVEIRKTEGGYALGVDF